MEIKGVVVESNKKIVVIGGGPAGLTLISKLEKELGSEGFAFIEPREYVEVPFAVLRGLTEPDGIGKSMRKPWSEFTNADSKITNSCLFLRQALRRSEKNVTLVAGRERLLPELKPGLGKKAFRVLSSRGVSLVLGKRLEEKDGRYFDRDGTLYEADLIYKAIGVRADAIPVDGEESINDSGQLRVGSDLRVIGRKDVFAIGDVNDLPEIKLGANARSQALAVARSVVALSGNRDAILWCPGWSSAFRSGERLPSSRL